MIDPVFGQCTPCVIASCISTNMCYALHVDEWDRISAAFGQDPRPKSFICKGEDGEECVLDLSIIGAVQLIDDEAARIGVERSIRAAKIKNDAVGIAGM